MAERVLVLLIPQLRHANITPGALASLEAISARGALAEFLPVFPSLAAPSAATFVTGSNPSEHGVVGDSFFDRVARRLVSRPFLDELVSGTKIWERLRAARPGAKSLAWFAPSLQGAAVDVAAWVDPVAGLVTNPPELAERLTARFGIYPAQRTLPVGQPLPIAAMEWILKSAAELIGEAQPEFALVRLPFLGQIARRFGPDGREASRSVIELEKVLKPFLATLPKSTVVLAVTESISTPVIAPFYPNLVLRDLNLLELVPAEGGGLDVDIEASSAFAVCDHQVCHIYANEPGAIGIVAAGFSGASSDAIDAVVTGRRRTKLGLDHPRSGDVILVSCPDCWFAPNWWFKGGERPARLDAGSRLAEQGGDLDPRHVQGSLGAPPPNPEYHGIIISSRSDLIPEGGNVAANELAGLVARALELPA